MGPAVRRRGGRRDGGGRRAARRARFGAGDRRARRPELKLVVAQRSVNVPRYGKRVYFDPGVYVTAVGSALRFDVARGGYGKPITGTQIIRTAHGTVKRPLPRKMMAGWRGGLRRFLRITVKNTAGKVVGTCT